MSRVIYLGAYELCNTYTEHYNIMKPVSNLNTFTISVPALQ